MLITLQIWTFGGLRLWQNDIVVVHRRTTETEFRRDLGVGRSSRLEGVGCARTENRLHAARAGALRRVYDARNFDLFRLDLWHEDG